MPIQIKIQLPADRTKYGTLTLESNTQTIGPFECYGKADNASAAAKGNPTRDPTKSFGDTPTGRYRGFVNKIVSTPANDRTYGPQPVITLDPQSGQAKIAKENGRFGLLIHGGALNAAGRLRPTFGCVRVANDTMVKILAAIPAAEKIEVTITAV
jgi:hypothetical protein